MTAVMTAVAEPELWPEALDDLARFFGGVAAMVEFVHRGPGHAEVSSVDTTSEPPEGLSGFDVR